MLRPGSYCVQAEWDVVEPARIRPVAEEEPGIDEAARPKEEPERERVQARERHVARADHQRHEVVAERADGHRDDEEEDHRDAVCGEQLVVGGR